MKIKYFKLFLLGTLVLSAVSCKKYLDINSDPDSTQEPDASSVLPAMLAAIPRGIQYDARFLGLYNQNFVLRSPTATSTEVSRYLWETHGYNPGSDNGGDIWRQTYYGLGANLNYIIDKGKATEKWDYVGVGYALKAHMFLQSTSQNGPIIFREAFKPGLLYFKYDDQDVVLPGIDSLCREALSYLSRSDGKVSTASLGKGDYVYAGDRTKWTKFVYGTLARLYSMQTNKAQFVSQYADSVIKFADLSFEDGLDDFMIPFDATKNDDANFFGTYRDNLTYFRQSNMIVKLLDGTALAGSNIAANRDPRMPQMISASQDTTNGNGGYRGIDPTSGGDPAGTGTTGANARKRVAVLWGDSLYANPSSNVFSTTYGKYLFRDKAVMPIMTYSEIQFMKAEAAFKKSNPGTAYTAYINGIRGHFAFINRTVFPRSGTALYTGSPISTSRINSYMAGANVKQTAGALTLSDIMQQKYIALWGWGYLETWTDLRKYHYTDIDPATGAQIYKSFAMPTVFYANNGGPNLAYRVRPRYNSEYVWNQASLDVFGGLADDYHTKPTWVILP